MKKLIAMLLVVTMLLGLGLLSGCKQEKAEAELVRHGMVFDIFFDKNSSDDQ